MFGSFYGDSQLEWRNFTGESNNDIRKYYAVSDGSV